MAASTVWEILKKAGIDPAPRRTCRAWSQFLRSQAEAILACDFFTAGLLDGTQAYVLAVIEHASHPDLESGPSAADPAPVRDPSQSAPASPVTGRRCPAEATS